MFIFSTKLTKTKILTAALVSACLVLLLLVSIPAGIKASKDTVRGETNEERVKYLQTFGWQVSADPVEVVSVVIPQKFDKTYDDYNALQISQGFDLSGYKGDAGTRYTYTIANYPDQNVKEVFANVIVIKDQIVAADVSSVNDGGFMHTLQMPEKTSQTMQEPSVPTVDPVTRDEYLQNLSGSGK